MGKDIQSIDQQVYDLAKYRRAKKVKEGLEKSRKATEHMFEKNPALLAKAQRRMNMTPAELALEDLRWAEKQAQELTADNLSLACCQHCETLPRGAGVLSESQDRTYWRVECAVCKCATSAGSTPAEAAYTWNLHHMHRLKQNFR